MVFIKTLPNGYTGILAASATSAEAAQLYTDKTTNVFHLIENQYLFLTDDEGHVVDKYKWQDGKYKPIWRKPVESSAFGKVKAKNAEQECAIDLLLDETTTVKCLSGSFGSGKTFLTSACAFKMLQDGTFDRIVWVRNNVEVKDSNPIGHLKGDYYDKMSVWAMPLADHIGGKDQLDFMIEHGKIEVVHLGFLRGRDIKNSIIFCTEAEHLTREHVQLLLGRVSEGSILVLEGDFRQIDAKAFEKDNGLAAAIDCLKGNRLFSYVHMQESVRSETAKLADLLEVKHA